MESAGDLVVTIVHTSRRPVRYLIGTPPKELVTSLHGMIVFSKTSLAGACCQNPVANEDVEIIAVMAPLGQLAFSHSALPRYFTG